MPILERHQKIATLICLATVALVLFREESEPGLERALLVLVALLPVLFYRLLAWLASFGFPEYFARYFGSRNHPGPYAVFFWLLFLAACLVVLVG